MVRNIGFSTFRPITKKLCDRKPDHDKPSKRRAPICKDTRMRARLGPFPELHIPKTSEKYMWRGFGKYTAKVYGSTVF
jgi:hypothetical protein